MSTSFPTPSASSFSFSERDQRSDQAARKCEACHAQHGAAVKFTGSEKSCQEEQCRQDNPCDQANQQSFSAAKKSQAAKAPDSDCPNQKE